MISTNTKWFAALLALAMLAPLAGCGDDAKAIVGKWENKDNSVFEFAEDGTGLIEYSADSMHAMGTLNMQRKGTTLYVPPTPFTWEIEGGRLTMYIEMPGRTFKAAGKYKLSGSTLKIPFAVGRNSSGEPLERIQ